MAAPYTPPYHATNDPELTGDEPSEWWVIDSEARLVEEAGAFTSQRDAHNYIREHFMSKHWRHHPKP